MIRPSFLFLTAWLMWAALPAVDNYTREAWSGPYDFTVATNAQALFRVNPNGVVAGTAFRWRENGVDLADGNGITGSGTNTLRVIGSAARNGKSYTCYVTGLEFKTTPLNPALSAAAILTVVASPLPLAISNPANGTTLSGGQTYAFICNGVGTVWNHDFSYTPSTIDGANTAFDKYDGTQSYLVAIPAEAMGTMTVTVTAGGTTVTNTYPVQGTNYAPSAAPDTYRHPQYTLFPGYRLTIPASAGVLVNDTDPNGQPITAALATPPASGTLTFNADGSFSFLASADNSKAGDVTFTYRVTDGSLTSAPATVTIQVLPNPGDVNRDGVVDVLDLEIVTSHFQADYRP